MELLIVSLAPLLAGFLDSIVGGGGLILIPALFAIFPNTHPATLFGINKGASIWGTAVANAQYARRVDMRWAALLPAAAMGVAGSLAGAWLVTVISPGFFTQGAAVRAAGGSVLHTGKKRVGAPPHPALYRPC